MHEQATLRKLVWVGGWEWTPRLAGLAAKHCRKPLRSKNDRMRQARSPTGMHAPQTAQTPQSPRMPQLTGLRYQTHSGGDKCFEHIQKSCVGLCQSGLIWLHDSEEWSKEYKLANTRAWDLWHWSLSFLLVLFSFEWNSFVRHFLFFLMARLPRSLGELLWAEQLITGKVIRFQQVCQHAFHDRPQLQCQWFQETFSSHSVTEPETSNKQWRSKVMDVGVSSQWLI